MTWGRFARWFRNRPTERPPAVVIQVPTHTLEKGKCYLMVYDATLVSRSQMHSLVSALDQQGYNVMLIAANSAPDRAIKVVAVERPKTVPA